MEYEKSGGGHRLSISSDEDAGIIDLPMPESARTRLGVFRHQLNDLRKDCKSIQRRSRAVPYKFTLGWSSLTAAAYATVGWFVSSSSNPHPGHSLFLMYQLGALIGLIAGLFLLGWGWATRRSFKDDMDDLIEKIHTIDYAASVLRDSE